MADLKESGTVPVFSEELIMSEMCGRRTGRQSKYREAGRGSSSQVFKHMDLIVLRSSSCVTGVNSVKVEPEKGESGGLGGHDAESSLSLIVCILLVK